MSTAERDRGFVILMSWLGYWTLPVRVVEDLTIARISPDDARAMSDVELRAVPGLGKGYVSLIRLALAKGSGWSWESGVRDW